MLYSNPLLPTLVDTDSDIDEEKIRYIYKIMEKINSTNDINIVGRDIVDIMTDALNCIGGALFIVSEEGTTLKAFTYSRISIFMEKVIPLLGKPFQDYIFNLKEHQNYTVRTVIEKKMFIGKKYEDFMAPVLSKFISRSVQRAIGMKSIVSAPTIVMGKVVGVFQIAFQEEEISERKRSLMKLFSDQCAVAINNAQKYQKLQDQYEEMQQMLAQQSDFISMSTHQFRTPLSMALFQAQDLVTSLEKTLDFDFAQRQKEAIRMVVSLERLKTVMEKIFTVQGYDAGKIKPRFISVNLDDFTSSLYQKFDPIIQKENLQWSIENDFPKNSMFTFDVQQLEKMLSELMENAINFTPKNGKITLKIYIQEGELYFEVIDAAEGVPKKERGNIFKKFKGNHSMQSMGIGLGLYIAEKVVDLHKGSIWVEDTPGGGATFIVRLPSQGME